METRLVAILIAGLTIASVMPAANALTPRIDFNDNHYTYLTFGEHRICGDHMCKPHEWDQWMAQLMQNQLKNGGTVPLEGIPTSASLNQVMIEGNNGAINTSNGKISKVTTFDMGDNEFSSFVSISYNGYLDINHIVVYQKNSGISLLRAWIEPQWKSTINQDNVSFDSKESNLYRAKVINVVIVTDGKPAFSLDTLSSTNPFP
jgi:hypothetical protein